MDRRDFRILAHWYEHPFASYEELGRLLGLSGAAVKSRAESLRREGVLGGFWAVPGACLFGLHPRVFLFQADKNPNEALSAALREESVVWVKVYQNLALERRLPGTLAALCYLRDPVKTPSGLLKRFGRPSLVRTPGWPLATDMQDPVLSPLEWRVLRAMIEDPRASPSGLGKSARMTEKTARRIRTNLMAKGFVGVQPLVNGGRSRGVACYHLSVYAEPGAAVPDVSVVVEGTVIERIPDPPGTMTIGWEPSVAEVMGLEQRLLALPGVRVALLSSPIMGEIATQRLLGWIDERIAFWDRAKRD